MREWDSLDEWMLAHVGQPVYHAYEAMVEGIAVFWRALTRVIRPVLPVLLLAEVVAVVVLILWLAR